ncbi:MAG: hypothetical protein SGPRY_011468, partial [Prymnesium sp.]
GLRLQVRLALLRMQLWPWDPWSTGAGGRTAARDLASSAVMGCGDRRLGAAWVGTGDASSARSTGGLQEPRRGIGEVTTRRGGVGLNPRAMGTGVRRDDRRWGGGEADSMHGTGWVLPEVRCIRRQGHLGGGVRREARFLGGWYILTGVVQDVSEHTDDIQALQHRHAR